MIQTWHRAYAVVPGISTGTSGDYVQVGDVVKMTEGLKEISAKTLIEAMQDPVMVLDSRGLIVAQNAACRKMFGYALKDIAGKHLLDCSLASTYSLKEMKRARRSFSTAIKEDKGFVFEYEFMTKNGKSVHVLLSGSTVKDAKKRTTHIIAFLRDITERRKAEWEIRERRKEVTCLLGISELASEPELSVNAFVEGVVELLPPAWNYHEITCARIVLGGREFTTSNFRETPWKQAADIKVSGEQEGTIEVYYLEERPDIDAGPFLKEERILINTLAKTIGGTIERRRADEALDNSERELALRNRIAQVFLTVTEDEVMYNEILNVVLESLDSEFGVFGYIDKDGAFVVPSMTRHIWDKCKVTDKKTVFARDTWGDSTWPRAIKEKRIICQNEISTLTPEGHIPISRHISLPIIHHGDVIGLFQIANKRTEYDETDLQNLERIAQDVAPILSARLQRDQKEEEKKRAEEALQGSEEQLSAFMDSTTDAFFLWDSELNLLRVNPAGMKIISPEGKPENIIGTNIHDITPGKNRFAIYEKVVRTGEPFSTIDYIPHSEFDDIHLNLKAFKVGDGLGIITTDITELVQSERFAVLGQLGAGIGHELRNPLGAIKTAAYFLRMVFEEPAPEVKETIDIIEKEVVTSERIISNLLSYTRPRPATRRKVDINDVIAAALSTVTIPETVEVVSQLDEGIPTILADPSQLRQVFVNLILNAFQAMPKSGRLVVRSWSSGPDSVDVSIADTGVGISQENMPKIFNPLFTTKAKGIGLGLAIVKILVDGHDGTIDVQSEPNKGTTFTVRIPVVLREAE